MDTFANSTDPDKTARLIRIYTVCHSVIDFGLIPYSQQMMCPNSETDGPISEIETVNTVSLLSANPLTILHHENVPILF